MIDKIKLGKDCSVAEAVKAGAAFLQKNKIENADYDSFALLSDLNGMSRTDYYLKGSEVLQEDVCSLFVERVAQRAKHVPLQHIIGKAYFYGYEFYVNSDVLIPRQDTEVLVEEALKVLRNDNAIADSKAGDVKKMRVLDMCTGSGCILLTLALQVSLESGFGVDLSDKALQAAAKNCRKLHAEHVEFIESDIFKNVDVQKYGNLDLLISNPPYIRSDVIPTLSDEVRLHDPMMALDGFEDGLYFYREITAKAPQYLKKGGWLMYEIGCDQGNEVLELMKLSGFENVSVVKDLAGLDRVVRGRLS